MKRMTVKRKDGRWALANNDGASPMEQMDKIPQAINRLAAFENILGDEYDLDHLHDLAQAEKDGRLVVLEAQKGKRNDR